MVATGRLWTADRSGTRNPDDPGDPLELFEAHWQDPKPEAAHCEHLMQQAAAAVENALAEQVQQIAHLYGDPLDKAAS